MNPLLSEHITNKMPSGLIMVDRSGRITGHNPAAERIFEGTLTHRSLLCNLVREAHALQDLLNRCLTSGEVFTRVEFNVPGRTGKGKRIGINLSPITNSAGTVEGAICLLSDLTEIVELQNRIKLKDNFAALGEMSAGIAHEFKNSLATIVGYAQMSTSESDVRTLQGYAREIHKESQALALMVTDFLNFARPVTASLQDVDLTELLQNVIADVESRRPGKYEINFLASTAPVIACDPTLMRQSFVNLLINAVDALGENGVISVSLEPSRERGNIQIMIQDNGRGMSGDVISKIFLPFYTTKTHGTGLGLSLVQKIVLAHNGRIEVQSTEGKGTRFTVTLPKAQ
jgi:PAS domain S-box-containing protein